VPFDRVFPWRGVFFNIDFLRGLSGRVRASALRGSLAGIGVKNMRLIRV
jgi:hypothetical protein